MDPRVYWVGLNKIRGIGSVKTKKLLDYFGDLSLAWTASEKATLGSRAESENCTIFHSSKGDNKS